MLYLIKLFPEITIKSRPVRKRQTRQLRKNIRAVLSAIDPEVVVSDQWDSIEVETGLERREDLLRIRDGLACTPGISQFLEVEKQRLPDFETMLAAAQACYGDRLEGRSFAVRCKRLGRHDFNSVEVERYIGAGLLQKNAGCRVDLTRPEVTVALEIRHDTFFLVREQHMGLGGFPLGSQDSVLSLVSGGFDSAVSSFFCIRRGLQTHYCFFNLGGRAHELAVKEVALYLWMKFHSSHRVKFITVPFEAVLADILQRVDNAQMGVILKRNMLRAASRVAEELEIKALVTGESVAQVSSQTLTNLAVIDRATEHLVLRPLITSDKQTIIDTARQIGTEEFSRNVPEYCAAISRNPTTRARAERIEREESRCDPDIFEQAIAGARSQLITEIIDDFNDAATEVPVVAEPEHGATVIDIRHPDETQVRPPAVAAPEEGKLLSIPFYELRSTLDQMDKAERLLLYCDQGMMSRLHAAHLRDEGFANIAVLDPRQS